MIRRRIVTAYALLLVGNALAWLWALAAFHDHPALLGTALLAYGFGLRHGIDADHIAAIDNVTRKLMQEGRQPFAAGLFFAFGHSTIVVGLTAAVALTATSLSFPFEALRGIGGAIGGWVSALFLLAIAIANIVVLQQVYRAFRRTAARRQDPRTESEPGSGGLLVRLFRPALALVHRSWHMLPVGVLFGLGFDTATEIGLLGITAAQASHGLPIWSILAFPALFTAGMTLVDMTDSILMVHAYGWAVAQPIRKVFYNLTVTLASVAVALFLGSVEMLGLIGRACGLQGWFWRGVDRLTDSYGMLGCGTVGFFILSWLAAIVVYRALGGDRPVASA